MSQDQLLGGGKTCLNDVNTYPYTGIGHDTKTGLLTVRIHQDFATLDNMKEYEKTIRSVIGDEIDLKISNGGEYWTLGDCPNCPLND